MMAINRLINLKNLKIKISSVEVFSQVFTKLMIYMDKKLLLALRNGI